MAAEITITISATQAETTIKRLDLLFDKFERSVKTLITGVKTFESTLKKFGTSAHTASSKLKTLDGTMKKTSTSAKGLDASTKKVAASTERTKKGFMGLIPHVAAVTASYMAMRKALRAVTGLAGEVAEFEHIMARVGAVSGASAVQLDILTEAARAAGEGTIWTATESGEALKFLAMAGFNVEEAIGALPGVLDLATVGELALGRATDIVTDTLNAMGLEVSDLARVNDVFAATITSTNTDIKMMGQAMQYAAPMAGQLGYEIEEVSAMIGILSQSGVKAGKAGRGMQQMFLRTTKAAEGLGLAVGSKLIDVLEALNEKQERLIETLGETVAKTLIAGEANEYFGRIAVKHVLILMSNIDAYKKLKEELDNAEGSMAKMVEIIESDVVNSFEKLKSMIVSAAIESLYKYREEIREVIQKTTDWIQANKGLIAQKIERTITTIGDAINKIVKIYRQLPDGVIGATGVGLIGRILMGSGFFLPVASVALIYSYLKKIDALKIIPEETKELFFPPEYFDNLDKGTAKSIAAFNKINIAHNDFIFDVTQGTTDLWDTYSTAAAKAWVKQQKLAVKRKALEIGTLLAKIDAKEAFLEKHKGLLDITLDLEEAALRKSVQKYIDATDDKKLAAKVLSAGLKEIDKKRAAAAQKIIDDGNAAFFKSYDDRTEVAMKFWVNETKSMSEYEKTANKFLENMDKEWFEYYDYITETSMKYWEKETTSMHDAAKAGEKYYEGMGKNNDETYSKMLKKSGNFFEALEGYRLEDQGKWISWGNFLATLTDNLFDDIGDSFGDNVSGFITGEITSIGDFWDAMLDDMLNALASFISDLVSEWTTSGLKSLFSDIFDTDDGGGIFGGLISAIGKLTGLTGEGGILTKAVAAIKSLWTETAVLTDTVYTAGPAVEGFNAAATKMTSTVYGAGPAIEGAAAATALLDTTMTMSIGTLAEAAGGIAAYHAMLGSATFTTAGLTSATLGLNVATGIGVTGWLAVGTAILSGIESSRKMRNHLKDLQQQFQDYYGTLTDTEKATNTFAAAQLSLTDMTRDLNSAFFLTQATLGEAAIGEYTELAKLHGETIEQVTERYKNLGEAIKEFDYEIQFGRFVPSDLTKFINEMVTGIESAVSDADIMQLTIEWDEDAFNDVTKSMLEAGEELDHMVQEGFLTMDEYYTAAVSSAESYVADMKSNMKDLSTSEQNYINSMLDVWTASTDSRTAMSQAFFDTMEEDYRGLTEIEQAWVSQALTDYDSLTTEGTAAAQELYEKHAASYDMMSASERVWATNALSTITTHYTGATTKANDFFNAHRSGYETATNVIDKWATDTKKMTRDAFDAASYEITGFESDVNQGMSNARKSVNDYIDSIISANTAIEDLAADTTTATGDMSDDFSTSIDDMGADIKYLTSDWDILTTDIDDWKPKKKIVDIIYSVGEIPELATGGIVSGPMSGYPVILHGTERVTPMSDGGSNRSEERNLIINAPLINIEGTLVADKRGLNELADELYGRLYKLAKRGH